MKYNWQGIVLLLVLMAMQTRAKAGHSATLVVGQVREADTGQALEGATVWCQAVRLHATTDAMGKFALAVPGKAAGMVLRAQLIGFAPDSLLIQPGLADTVYHDFVLEADKQEIEGVTISGTAPKRGTIELVGVESLAVTGGAAGGGLETVLKVLPGVQSNNELSSQYSVRGGSFDENLTYINGVEVYRHALTRTGQQEGLSAINPHLVSSVEFSTGGFGAEYGDKLSSVLNVKYRRPTGFGGRAEASLLGAAVSVDYAGWGGKLSGATGVRYKRAAYLIGAMDTKGQYNPTFADVQTNLTYEVNRRLDINFIALAASNVYDFVPESRTTTFGTLANPVDFTVYYEGHERNQYQNLVAGLSAQYEASDRVQLNLSASAVWLSEREDLDILSEYWMSDLEQGNDQGNMMVGTARDHARNYRYTKVNTLGHSGQWQHGGGTLRWGGQFKWEQADDEVHQWQLLDSAGYMLPRANGQLRMYRFVTGSNRWENMVGSVYLQDNLQWEWAGQRWGLSPGVRLTHVQQGRQWLLSPRVQLQWYPSSNETLQYYLATGLYQQPAFVQEATQYDFEQHTVTLNHGLKAQQSLHVVLGTSTLMRYQDIPVKLTAELFYKRLRNMVAYRQDNVTLLYSGRNNAERYTYGFDLRLNAELIPGAESWLGVSLMQAQQRVLDAAYVGKDGALADPGYFPMANDQLINVSAMFQDMILSRPRFRLYALINYGSPLPAFVPSDQRYDLYFRMPAYFRADMGFSVILFDQGVKSGLGRRLPFLNSCVFTLEALNIFNIANTSSYLWVTLVGQQSGGLDRVAVPNFLTPFRLNGKITLSF